MRHTAWYEPTYRYGYNGDGYYHHHYYGDGGYYGHPYYRYGYYGRPYYGGYYNGYYSRPYRNYYLGYDYAGYADCGRIPLADGRGGWVWSVRAGCY